MRPQIWFGPRGYMRWVACPVVNYDGSRIGWSSGLDYLNGGASVRRSVTSHRTAELSWTRISREEARMITNVAEGVYGQNLIYWHDPFNSDANALPQFWATPALMGYDAPVLTGSRNQPTLVDTPFNGLYYPAESAQITTLQVVAPYELYIPIPPGYTAWFGAHGEGDAIVGVAPATGSAGHGTFTYPALLSVTDSTRFNHSVTSDEGHGMVLQFRNEVGYSATLSGMMVQVLRTGQTPGNGEFISGQGHSGVRFAAQPMQTNYSAAFDQVGVSAALVETGAWEHVPVPVA